MLMSKAQIHTSQIMFDFSRFSGGNSTRPVQFIGLSEAQTKGLLDQQYGLTECLMEHYPDVTKRGNNPNSVSKCLIVWEHNGRRTTYTELANALDITEDSAYQAMLKGKKWIEAGFGLRVEHKQDEIYLVTNESLGQRVERLDKRLKPVERQLKDAIADVKSIVQAGDTPVLGGSMGKLVTAYASLEGVDLQAPALEGSEAVNCEIA